MRATRRASASVHVIKNFTGGVAAIIHVRPPMDACYGDCSYHVVGGGGRLLLTRIDARVASAGLATRRDGVYLRFAPRRAAIEKRTGSWSHWLCRGSWCAVRRMGRWDSNLMPRCTRAGRRTVNNTELFIALAISGAFLFTIGLSAFGAAALGLLIGGVIAAPLGGYVAKHVPARPMMIMVGIVLTLTSLLGLWTAMK